MPDTTIKKVEAGFSPKGEMGQRYLVAGKRVSMRLWVQEPGGKLKAPNSQGLRDRGLCHIGSARLDLEGQTLNLKAGDLWLVPAGAREGVAAGGSEQMVVIVVAGRAVTPDLPVTSESKGNHESET